MPLYLNYNEAMTMPILEVKNLTKKFGPSADGFTAVDDISFSIKEGEIVGLLGPNGAGKTTTIQMILGLIIPTAGFIDIFNRRLENHREEILQQMNFSSTYTNFPWRLTVWENLYVVALLYSVKHPKDKINQILKLMHLDTYRNQEVGQLSSGWVTKLNLARTFINDPRFVLLDEPTASLDPESAADIRSEILKKRTELNTTILWTSHNMAEVEEVCDRVIFLHHGQIVAEDTPAGLAKRIKTCRVSFMVEENSQKLENLTKINRWKCSTTGRFIKIELKEEEIPHLLKTLTQEKIKYDEISIDKPTLEDYFLSVAQIHNYHEKIS